MQMTRRVLLAGVAGGVCVLALRRHGVAATQASYPFQRTDAQWRAMLSPAAYGVLRQADTEPPFTSKLLDQHHAGMFTCAGCRQDLFASGTKFDSGTGWPSFWQPLPKAVLTSDDSSLGMDRTEVHCSNCGGHLGHVFEDGPKPTGLRYCMNGVALGFRTA